MTQSKFVAGGAILAALIASAAFAAHGAGDYVCQAWSPAKTGRTVTHCITWSREAAAQMRAAGCDPAMMSDAAMRAQCAAMMAERRGEGSTSATAG